MKYEEEKKMQNSEEKKLWLEMRMQTLKLNPDNQHSLKKRYSPKKPPSTLKVPEGGKSDIFDSVFKSSKFVHCWV